MTTHQSETFVRLVALFSGPRGLWCNGTRKWFKADAVMKRTWNSHIDMQKLHTTTEWSDSMPLLPLFIIQPEKPVYSLTHFSVPMIHRPQD